ncbi:unnamed protein product, partial [Tilletia caries]
AFQPPNVAPPPLPFQDPSTPRTPPDSKHRDDTIIASPFPFPFASSSYPYPPPRHPAPDIPLPRTPPPLYTLSLDPDAHTHTPAREDERAEFARKKRDESDASLQRARRREAERYEDAQAQAQAQRSFGRSTMLSGGSTVRPGGPLVEAKRAKKELLLQRMSLPPVPSAAMVSRLEEGYVGMPAAFDLGAGAGREVSIRPEAQQQQQQQEANRIPLCSHTLRGAVPPTPPLEQGQAQRRSSKETLTSTIDRWRHAVTTVPSSSLEQQREEREHRRSRHARHRSDGAQLQVVLRQQQQQQRQQQQEEEDERERQL